MSLARQHELNGPFRVVDQLEQPVLIFKDQPGAFIRGKASRESDGQSVRTERHGEQCRRKSNSVRLAVPPRQTLDV